MIDMTKYENGRLIKNMGDFEDVSCSYSLFRLNLGEWRTLHRGFIESLQYRTLKNYIDRGWVRLAVEKRKDGDFKNEHEHLSDSD